MGAVGDGSDGGLRPYNIVHVLGMAEVRPSSIQKIAVTGATGLVGRALCVRLESEGFPIERFSRTGRGGTHGTGLIGPLTDWKPLLRGVSVVVHLAARVHVMGESGSRALDTFRQTNVKATRKLALDAVKAGVSRMVFVSTVKVNGESTRIDKAFGPDDPPAPIDAYAVSKWEAEEVLRAISVESGLELVIVRPPLVYGPGATANFARLIGLVESGIPLPLASVRNLRSLVAVDNLAHLLALCVTHSAACGRTLMVSDDHDLSTPSLVQEIARALRRPARLIPFPTPLLRVLGQMLGKGEEVGRLCDSLRVDMSATRKRLGWQPPISISDAIDRAVSGQVQ